MSGHIPQEHFEPKSKLGKWADERLPLVRFVADFAAFPTPKNLNWMWIWGIVLSFCLVLQIATGLFLTMHYKPNVDDAMMSVEHIMRNVNGGWLIRFLHANGASLFFFAVYMHIFRGLFYGSYKAPREILWIIGVLIYLVMMGTAFMGYVLPWGQMSLHGASVITNLFDAIPLIGPGLKVWLQGGEAVSDATLNRFFALHYLLPFVIAGLVVLHIWALHVVGNGNPTGVEMRKDTLENVKKDSVPFHPYYTVKDLFGLMIVLIVFAVFVYFLPNYLGHPDNYIEGDALKTPEHIVPEWYFLPFYAILRAIDFSILGIIDAKLAGFLAMMGAILVWIFLPWLDTSNVRSGAYRTTFKWFFVLLVIDFLLLMQLGARSPDEVFRLPFLNIPLGNPDHPMITCKLVSLICTIYWFAYFLVILPLLGLTERALQRPASIEADFADKHPAE